MAQLPLTRPAAAAARAKGPQSQERLKRAYGKLLNSTSRVVGQAKRFSKEISKGVKRSTDILKQMVLEGLRQQLDVMVPLVKQVMKQTRARNPPPRAAADEQLMFQQQGFSHDDACSARAQEFGNGGQQVDAEYEQMNHRPGR